MKTKTAFIVVLTVDEKKTTYGDVGKALERFAVAILEGGDRRQMFDPDQIVQYGDHGGYSWPLRLMWEIASTNAEEVIGA